MYSRFITAALLLLNRLVSADTCGISAPTLQLGLRNCSFPATGQSNVHSWGILLGVAGSNQLCAVPSTVVNATLLMSEEVCNDNNLLNGTNRAQCRSRRGGFLQRSTVPDFSG